MVVVEVKAILVCIPLFLSFILGGTIVNIIQALCFVIVWPISRNWYTKINGAVSAFLWLGIVFVIEWWAGVEVHLHTDRKTYELMGKENAIFMPNHPCDLDIFLVWLLAERYGSLRSALMVVKKSAKYLPIFGWGLWFFGFVFLDRSWEKDQHTLTATFKGLKDYPMPFWLAIFLEGTRMTPDKLHAAQQFAISRGLPVPKNVLIPRTKGFVEAMKNMRSFVPAIYDVTTAIPDGHPTPTLLRCLKSDKNLVVHVHIKRIPTSELPETDDGIAQWSRDRFIAKDAMLEKFRVTGQFEKQEVTTNRRSKNSLFAGVFGVVCCLSSVLIVIQRFSLLSSWEGISSIAAGFVSISILSHVFIDYARLPPQQMKKIDTKQM